MYHTVSSSSCPTSALALPDPPLTPVLIRSRFGRTGEPLDTDDMVLKCSCSQTECCRAAVPVRAPRRISSWPALSYSSSSLALDCAMNSYNVLSMTVGRLELMIVIYSLINWLCCLVFQVRLTECGTKFNDTAHNRTPSCLA